MNESGDPDTFNSCGPHDSSLIMAFPSKKKRKKKSRSFDEKNSSDILIIKKEIIERYRCFNWRKIVLSNCSISTIRSTNDDNEV